MVMGTNIIVLPTRILGAIGFVGFIMFVARGGGARGGNDNASDVESVGQDLVKKKWATFKSYANERSRLAAPVGRLSYGVAWGCAISSTGVSMPEQRSARLVVGKDGLW